MVLFELGFAERIRSLLETRRFIGNNWNLLEVNRGLAGK